MHLSTMRLVGFKQDCQSAVHALLSSCSSLAPFSLIFVVSSSNTLKAQLALQDDELAPCLAHLPSAVHSMPR